MRSTVVIGERPVGDGTPVLVIAEVGVNHDGDLGAALALVDAAAAAGVEVVKFQTFRAAALATPTAALAPYQQAGSEEAIGQLELLERLELSSEDFGAISRRCRDRGVIFLSTPFDRGSAALLEELGVPAFKVSSGELTNLPFLQEIAAVGLPVLLSTGMATLGEVRAAVDTVSGAGAPLVLLHCVSSYPTPPREANLRAIDTLRAAFDVPVGYSDHCLGLDVSLAAVARDACVIERHLTLDRRRRGPDHAMSLEPNELGELVERVRELEAWLGSGIKVPQPSEVATIAAARRSIVAAVDLAAGEVLTSDSLAIRRPGGGLAPDRLTQLVGRRLARSVSANEQLSEQHLAEQR